MTVASPLPPDPAPLEAIEPLGLTEPRAQSLLERIRRHNADHRVWTLVLDDDPTGTQTVANVPVVTANWSEADLRWGCAHESGVTFVLTNSRSLESAEAGRVVYEVTRRAAQIARKEGRQLRLVTRSDSTLRGHFATEIKAARLALEEAGHAVSGALFVPSYPEAGRYTAQDIQWVCVGESIVPAAITEFARDEAFGYTELSLRDWIPRQLGSALGRLDTVGLPELRRPDAVDAVHAHLTGLGPDDVLLANAVRAQDLEVIMAGLALTEAEDRQYIVRSAPSFVRLCAGQPPSEPIGQFPPSDPAQARGLVVVGSHTQVTNDQLVDAQRELGVVTVEFDVRTVLDSATSAEEEILRCVATILGNIRHFDVVLRTSREFVSGAGDAPLVTSRRISKALCKVVRLLADVVRPSFVIAKGGITSSDVATQALGVTRTIVRGQMGVGKIALWSLEDGVWPGVPYVVFPGNLGDESALTRAIQSVGGRVA